jgi:hypothetical protein
MAKHSLTILFLLALNVAVIIIASPAQTVSVPRHRPPAVSTWSSPSSPPSSSASSSAPNGPPN